MIMRENKGMALRIEKILSSRIAESEAWDFKSAFYGSGEADVFEFLKDVTSFANAGGGTIVLGVSTDQAGRASTVEGVVSVQLDKDIQRLEHILRDSVEPDITGAVRITDESADNGKRVVFIDIHDSSLAPHRIVRRGKFKSHFFVRRGRRSEEADVYALRELFEGRSRVSSLFQKFVEERVATVLGGEYLAGQEAVPQLLMHIGPQRSFGSRKLTDFLLEPEHHFALAPPNDGGYRARPNIYGVISRSGDVRNPYNQAFHNGCLEMLRQAFSASRTDVMSGIDSTSLAGFFLDDLPKAVGTLAKVFGEEAYFVSVSFIRIPPVEFVVYRHGTATRLANSIPPTRKFQIPTTVIRTGAAEPFHQDIRELLNLVWRAWGQDQYPDAVEPSWMP